MTNMEHYVRQFERTLRDVGEEPSSYSSVRRYIRTSLQNIAQMANDSSDSLADTLEAIATDSSHINSAATAAAVIRLVSYPDLLPASAYRKSGRHIVHIVDRGLPAVFPHLSIDPKSQTHEKLEALRQAHLSLCEYLQPLEQPFNGLHDLIARRQTIMRSLNYGPTKRYLGPFGFQSILSSITSILSLSDKVVNSHGREFQSNLQDLLATLSDEVDHYTVVPTFVAQDFLLPFLRRIDESGRSLLASMAEKFECRITISFDPYELEKRFPLHVIGAEIRVYIPMTNEGPGVAEGVRALCITEHCEVQTDEIALGNIDPGPFVLPIVLKVNEVRERIELDMEIEWTVVGQTARRKHDFTIIVLAQRADVDWTSLARHQPYSLEVAYSEEFYGRSDAIQRILRRLTPTSMQSCYITGQKRVGKSSLARAVESQLLDGAHGNEYQVLYLECGEIRHDTGKGTLQEFGVQLAAFLMSLLSMTPDSPTPDYSSSLNPLNPVLKKLEVERPTVRAVVILDEFDEINEELYRYGELANTFFLNLRTLASKRNLAFILVGAERMPYVMASQGEKLNRFARESLDNFDRATEWADYTSLVEQPVSHAIKFHESALRRLFELTNGHPYFTKVLCATVFEGAVEAKDAEVAEAEIKKSAERVVATLDTIAFAHYWRDGIRGDSNDIEIISLNRCRVLVAWARASRSKQRTTHEAILDNLHSSMLPAGEVMPLLDDFCRRSVFRHKEDSYFPTVELFAVWLREGGFARLISDQLGDELAEAKQQREDGAYVHATEIVSLVEGWDLYQGRQITAENVRAWLGQVDSNVQQRLLFKLLQHVRFVRDPETRERFAHAHNRIRSRLPVYVRRSRAQRRGDIFVTYADGAGKSGAHYASLYALENDILAKNVIEPLQINNVVVPASKDGEVGLVVVDDMIGTGNSLISCLTNLLPIFSSVGVGTIVPLSVVVLCGTELVEGKVREFLEDRMPNADLEICEILDRRHYAFSESLGFWDSEEEKEVAKSLLLDLGSRVQKRNPLGYGSQGLLLTFPRNCPNNSLPILHRSGRGSNKWSPVFPRSLT